MLFNPFVVIQSAVYRMKGFYRLVDGKIWVIELPGLSGTLAEAWAEMGNAFRRFLEQSRYGTLRSQLAIIEPELSSQELWTGLRIGDLCLEGAALSGSKPECFTASSLRLRPTQLGSSAREELKFTRDLRSPDASAAEALLDCWTHISCPNTTSVENWREVDQCFENFMKALPEGQSIAVVSPVGWQPCRGGFRLNKWLYEAGFLVPKADPPSGKWNLDAIDWHRSIAWAEGEHTGRIFLNIEGRESRGIVKSADYEKTRSQIANALQAFWKQTNPAPLILSRPESGFGEIIGRVPDLWLGWPEGGWRILDDFSMDQLIEPPDSPSLPPCSLGGDGFFAISSSIANSTEKAAFAGLEASTFLRVLLHNPPPAQKETPLETKPPEADCTLSEDEEQTLAERLRALGYMD